jgi:hypothetical protein
MHRSLANKFVTFIALLLVALCSLSKASPIADGKAASEPASAPRDLNTVEIVRRQNQATVYATAMSGEQPGTVVELPLCIPNYDDGAMCTVGYFTAQGWGYVSFHYQFSRALKLISAIVSPLAL